MKLVFAIGVIIINIFLGASYANTHINKKISLQTNYEKHSPSYVSKAKIYSPNKFYNNKNLYGENTPPKQMKYYKIISSLREKRNQSINLVKTTNHKNINYKFSLIQLPLPVSRNSVFLKSQVIADK
jgi:hypothetical protein